MLVGGVVALTSQHGAEVFKGEPETWVNSEASLRSAVAEDGEEGAGEVANVVVVSVG